MSFPEHLPEASSTLSARQGPGADCLGSDADPTLSQFPQILYPVFLPGEEDSWKGKGEAMENLRSTVLNLWALTPFRVIY